MSKSNPALIQLGKRIKQLRENTGLSQEELCVLIDLHRTFLSSIERGINNISFLNLLKVATCLGVTISELLEGIVIEVPEATKSYDRLFQHIERLKNSKNI